MTTPATPATPAVAPVKQHWWKDKAFAIQVGVGAAIAAAAAWVATKSANGWR